MRPQKGNSYILEGLFAGGDIVTGAATIIEAMGAGRKAPKAMDEYARSVSLPAEQVPCLPTGNIWQAGKKVLPGLSNGVKKL